MRLTWITRIAYRDAQGAQVAAQAAVLGAFDAVESILADHLSRSGAQLLGCTEPREVMSLARSGSPTELIGSLSREIRPERPVVIRKLAAGGERPAVGGEGAPDRHLDPSPPFVIVFNAAEALETFEALADAGTPYIDIMSFHGAALPCTIGIPFAEWNAEAENLCLAVPDAYVLSAAQPDFIVTSKVPMAEMLVERHCTLNNPFDPKAVRSARQARAARTAGPQLLEFSAGRFKALGPAAYRLDFLAPGAPPIRRLVALACLCALGEMFREARFKFIGARDDIRWMSGVIKRDGYQGFATFSGGVLDDAVALLMEEIAAERSLPAYGDMMKIVRGLAIAGETKRRQEALDRWRQLRSASAIDQEQRFAQFQIEALSLHLQRG